MKAGIATTEFWITLVITMMNAFIQGGILPVDFPGVEMGAMITNGVVVVAYIVSRWVVKKNTPTE